MKFITVNLTKFGLGQEPCFRNSPIASADYWMHGGVQR